MGRRRYSAEWKRNQNRPQQPPSAIAGLLVVLIGSYIFVKPVFWFFAGLLAFIAACFAVIGLCIAWEWLSRLRKWP
jgi:hypothetical protein